MRHLRDGGDGCLCSEIDTAAPAALGRQWLCSADGRVIAATGGQGAADGQGATDGKGCQSAASDGLSDVRLQSEMSTAAQRGRPCLLPHPAALPGRADRHLCLEPLSPPPTLLIVGSGHIAAALAPMAASLGYVVWVVDDRPDYLLAPAFKDARRLCCGPVLEQLASLPLHAATFAVLVTRSHQADAQVLAALLQASALPYVGMVGSRRRIRGVLALLDERGVPADRLLDLYAPIGLDIGAEEPAEIALSILAEIQRVRTGGSGESLARRQQSEYIHGREHVGAGVQLALWERMAVAVDAGEAFVAATVVATRGHVPRASGTKMLVFADGSLYQTIGGGKREEDIRQHALRQLQSGQPGLCEVHFHGEYDSAEPVCGGQATVWLQPFAAGR